MTDNTGGVRNQDVYGFNAKRLTISHILLAGAAASYVIIPIWQKITLRSAGFGVGHVSGTFSTALGTWGLYKGTVTAANAAAAAGNLTGLTQVCSITAVAASVLKGTYTPAVMATSGLDIDGTLGVPTALVAYCDIQGSNTLPGGAWHVNYVLRDEAA